LKLGLSHRRQRADADNSQQGYRHAYDTQTSLGKSPLIEQVSAFSNAVSMIRNDHPAWSSTARRGAAASLTMNYTVGAC
jgi:hypothetical protein